MNVVIKDNACSTQGNAFNNASMFVCLSPLFENEYVDGGGRPKRMVVRIYSFICRCIYRCIYLNNSYINTFALQVTCTNYNNVSNAMRKDVECNRSIEKFKIKT